MATPTTIDTDTELSAVNSILGAIGQSPITTLNYTNPEIAFIYNIFTEVNKDVQNEGWVFNIENHVTISPNTSDKHIPIAANILRYDLCDGQIYRAQDVVRRTKNNKAYLYDRVNHTYEFDNDVDLDITYLFQYEDLPTAFKRYIVSRASVRAATQLVNNPQLVQLLQQQEAMSRAACMEYECNQGDHSYLGFGHNQSYRAYQPYKALQR